MSEKYKFDDPEGVYFVTLGIVFWIDLFTRKDYKHNIVNSLKHCQNKKGLIINAWCLMPSHLHMIIRSSDQPLSNIMRDFKKFTSKEIVKITERINESRKEWLLRAFKKSGENLKRITNNKVWKDGNHPELLMTNKFIDQKLIIFIIILLKLKLWMNLNIIGIVRQEIMRGNRDYLKSRSYNKWGTRYAVLNARQRENGILNGKRVEYYETGEIRSQTHWKDGLQNGKSIYFFQNGEIESVSYYEEGLLNDTSKLFYSNGKLKDLSFWIDGKLHGQRKKFHMNGVLSFEGNYDYDQPYGKLFFYNEDGSLKYFKEYDYEPKINLAVEKDTLYVKDTINLKISFTNNLHDSIAYLIGSFDENYNLVDTIYSSEFTSDSAEYSFVAEDLGSQKIMGIIQDIEIKDGYLIAKSIPFIKNYYVMQR